MIDDVSSFWDKHKKGLIVDHPAYTSTSLEIYDYSMDVQFVIISKSGRNISKYNPKEKEILFKRNGKFIVTEVKENTIY